MARVLLLLAVLAAVWTWAPASPPCSEVMKMVIPCVPYLTKGALQPGGGCCSGVRALRQVAKTHDDKVAICKCLKGFAGQVPGFDYSRAARIPQQCGVHMNFTFSPSTDCNKIPGAEGIWNHHLL